MLPKATFIKINATNMNVTGPESENLNLNDIKDRIRSFTYCTRSNDDNIYNINIVQVTSGISYYKKWLNSTENTAKELKNIEIILKQDINHFCMCYQDFYKSEKSNITIFTSVVNEKLIDLLFSLLPQLPNLNLNIATTDATYNKRIAILNEFFKNIYYHLQNNTPLDNTTMKNLIVDFENTFDFKKEMFNDFIKNLTDSRTTYAKTTLSNKLYDLNLNISSYEQNLQNFYVKKAETQHALIAFEHTSAENVEELIKSITTNPMIEIIRVSNATMTLRVTTPLLYFSDKDYACYERKTNPILQNTYEYERDKEVILKILHKLFITKEYKLILQANINLTINRDTSNMLTFTAHKVDTYLTECPNPHLYKYDCWSDAKTIITKFISENKYDLAVLQMIAAVGTVNIAEEASFIKGLLQYFKRGSEMNRHIHIIDETKTKRTWNEIIQHELDLEKNANITPTTTPTTTTTPRVTEYTQIIISEENIE